LYSRGMCQGLGLIGCRYEHLNEREKRTSVTIVEAENKIAKRPRIPTAHIHRGGEKVKVLKA